MPVNNIVLFVEEPSMEAFLDALLPRFLSPEVAYEIHPFQGKLELLANLESRLRVYARQFSRNQRIVVMVDRDREGCRALKERLEKIARNAGLSTRSNPRGKEWQLVNRIVIEELEAWYFGDWTAVCEAFPRVSPHVPGNKRFRDPDAIAGGTWEAFEQVMQKFGYFQAGLPKIEAARRIGSFVDPSRNRSRSFQVFWKTLIEDGPLVEEPPGA